MDMVVGTILKVSLLEQGLDHMDIEGPFQFQPYCDSVFM